MPTVQSNGLAHFNSRPYVRCDQEILIEAGRTFLFQFAPPREGRQQSTDYYSNEDLISIRAPCKGRPNIHAYGVGIKFLISIRALAGGRLKAAGSYENAKEFQFAPPQGGRHSDLGAQRSRCAISIRAPARGATQAGGNAERRQQISIRAPARGATRQPPYLLHAIIVISIRAPARGATSPDNQLDHCSGISIRAPTRGATSSGRWILEVIDISIRAPTRGRLGLPVHYQKSVKNFNSRPRKGGDNEKCGIANDNGEISIRAPARGATAVLANKISLLDKISIRAPARGATH